MSTIRTRVLILQHPQEPDKELNSVHLLKAGLPDLALRVGLSWANLGKALQNPADAPKPESKRWGTLFLGSQSLLKDHHGLSPGLYFVARDKTLKPVEPGSLDGLIALDGTWAQGKTLWWRNSWLTKTRRLVLIPPARSLYGKKRKEPRPECVSTLECVAYALEYLGEPAAFAEGLIESFKSWLKRPAPSQTGR